MDHGGYNKYLAYFFISMLVPLYLMFKLLQIFYRKLGPKKCVLISIPTLIIFSLLSFYVGRYIFKYQDRNWERGLNNVWLDKSHHDIPAKCKIKEYWFPNYDVGAKYLI